MDRIYNDAKDKNVAAVLVYANSEKALFYDAEFTDAVDADDCLELFSKGVICLYDGTYYNAVSCTDAGVLSFGLPA